MQDEKLRAAIREMATEMGWDGQDEPQPLLYTNHSYDKSIVGITTEGSVVYDEDSMIAELMEDEGWTYDEAVEWYEYNTKGAYFSGGIMPTIITSRQEILDRYGE